MKKYFHKEITECYRYSYGDPTAKHKTFDSLEDAPTKESIRKLYRNRKEFSDHIKPLYRFLVGNVGRPWNKVYSEISEHIKLSSTMQRHILEHVDGYVETKVQMIDGKPYRMVSRYWHGHGAGPIPIESYRNYTQLYVNPVTGLLCAAPRRKVTPRIPEVTLISVPDNKYLQYRFQVIVKHKGRHNERTITKWIALELSDRPEKVTQTDVTPGGFVVENGKHAQLPSMRNEVTFTPGNDVFFKTTLRSFTETDSEKYYGDPNLYCSKVRDVNTKELELINTTLASKG